MTPTKPKKEAILTELKKRGWSVSLGEFTTGLLFKREEPERFFTWDRAAEMEGLNHQRKERG